MKDIKRKEIKYLIGFERADELKIMLAPCLKPDEHSFQRVHNVYFDNAHDEIIRASIEKPPFKQKLRLRAYEADGRLHETAFFELKKKFDGVVYKRRLSLPLETACAILGGAKPETVIEESQIAREIGYFIQKTACRPKAYIGYDRYSMVGARGEGLRVTFDTNISSRFVNLGFHGDARDRALLAETDCLMEIKANGGMPVRLAGLLTEMRVYPISFSKYGRAYERRIQEDREGKTLCLTA